MLELKEKTLNFFREMEANIRWKIEKARQIDEENAKRRANSEGEEDGFYYLDDRGDTYELNDAKEAEPVQTRGAVPFSGSPSNPFASSQSSSNLEGLNRPRPTLAARAASGSVDFSGMRESLSSVDYSSYDPKLTGRTRKNSSSGLGMGPPRRIRTISTMDGEFPPVIVIVFFHCLSLGRRYQARSATNSIFIVCLITLLLTICWLQTRSC